MTIIIPDNVRKIIGILEKNGYEAYAVGGCVRDTILGRNPNDWDITTSAKPGEIKALFRRTVDTGIKHGTVTVLFGPHSYEVTTYRIDGVYEDSRHPKTVTFTGSLSEDLRRRDFTVNAMAYNDRKGLVDLFGGQCDIENKVIRAVGEPKERFTEDALRIMRCIRFSAQLGFEIDKDTFSACRELSGNLKNISRERIHDEFLKILESDHPEYVDKLAATGAMENWFPLWKSMKNCAQQTKYHDKNVWEHTLSVLKASENDRIVRIAAFLHDIGKPGCKSTDEKGCDHFYAHDKKGAELADSFLKELRFDNDTRNRTVQLVEWHEMQRSVTRKAVRKVMGKIGAEDFERLMKLIYADAMGKSPYGKQVSLDDLEKVREYYLDALKENDCLNIGMLALSGRDLMQEGYKAGREMGEMLSYLLDKVLENPELNTKEQLLKLAGEKGKQG